MLIERCCEFLSILPKSVNTAFAYGSSILSANNSHKMIDLILIVDDATSFHSENILINPKHYSACRFAGPSRLANLQCNFGARMFYNTLITYNGRLFKYGVITTGDFISDLYDWDFLYVSGRLQKPVLSIRNGISDELGDALRGNLASALHVSLLLLPETFSEEDLFRTIVWLSYSGDFRLLFGEDKGKIGNIVRENLNHFRNLYGPLIEGFGGHLYWHQKDGIFEQQLIYSSRLHHLNHLPKNLQLQLWHKMNMDQKNPDIEEILMTLAHNPSKDVIVSSIKAIVSRASLSQAFKGIITAGLTKSVKYSLSKVYKMYKSIFNKPL